MYCRKKVTLMKRISVIGNASKIDGNDLIRERVELLEDLKLNFKSVIEDYIRNINSHYEKPELPFERKYKLRDE